MRPFLAIFILLVLPLTAHSQTTAPSQQPRLIILTAPAFKDALQPLAQHRATPAGGNFQTSLLSTADLLTPAELQQRTATKLLEKLTPLLKSDAPTTTPSTLPNLKSPISNPQTFLLLVGPPSTNPFNPQTNLPIHLGTAGRMTRQPTDNPFALPDPKTLQPTIPVGRLPVRTPAEATAAVNKILAFEKAAAGGAAWRRNLTLLVGNPIVGENASLAEKTMANWFVNSSLTSTTDRIHPLWTLRSLVHIPASPFTVPDDKLHDTALDYLQQGNTFSFYLGHSSVDALWSGPGPFLTRDDFAKLKAPDKAGAGGVFITCSCWAALYDPGAREANEGYALAAIRNPTGPVAVIAPTRESYSVAGYLAMNGMLDDLASDHLPKTLGELFLHAQAGLASGPVDFFTFRMFDYGDGSNGNIPLDTQRKEHIEMWSLLGDPTLQLPTITPELTVTAPPTATSGAPIQLQIVLPKDVPLHPPIPLTVTVETGRSEAPQVLVTQRVTPGTNPFVCTIEVPSTAKPSRLIVRVTDGGGMMGATTVKLVAPATQP